MLKHALIGLSLFAIALLVALSFLTAKYLDKEEIGRAKLELERMRFARDSLLAVNAIRDSMQAVVQEAVADLQEEAEGLRDQVANLERTRQQQHLSVRRLWRPAELQQRFAETFPAVANSDWGVTEITNDETGLRLQYLAVPLGFSETFILDHIDAANYKQQRDRLSQVDSLQILVGTYKDSLFTLERERSLAWREGYLENFDRYETLNEKYVGLLEQPPSFQVFPGRRGVLIGGAAGVLAGATVVSFIK